MTKNKNTLLILSGLTHQKPWMKSCKMKLHLKRFILQHLFLEKKFEIRFNAVMFLSIGNYNGKARTSHPCGPSETFVHFFTRDFVWRPFLFELMIPDNEHIYDVLMYNIIRMCRTFIFCFLFCFAKPIEIAFYLLTGSVFRMPFDRGSAVLGLMTGRKKSTLRLAIFLTNFMAPIHYNESVRILLMSV
jgi:hypothetical protein